MTHSNVLIILGVDDLKPCRLQDCLLLLVLRLLISHLDQLIHIIRPKLHLIYLPI